MSQGRRNDQAVYGRLIKRCPRYRFPDRWESLRADAQCRTCPPDTEALLARLQDEFRPKALTSSGVARGPSAELQLTAALRSGRPIISLRHRRDADPYEIITGRGAVTEKSIPALAVLRDARTRALFKRSEGRLFVAFDVHNAIWLRTLGLPAATATGLLQADRHQIQELAEKFGWGWAPSFPSPEELSLGDDVDEDDDVDTPMPDEAEAAEVKGQEEQGSPQDVCVADGPGPSLELVLVGWRPFSCTLTEPKRLGDVVSCLLDLEQRRGLDLSTVGVWRPTEDELEDVESCIHHGEVQQARQLLLQSAEDYRYALHDWDDQPWLPKEPTSDYLAARRHLRQTQRRHARGQATDDEIRQASEEFEDAVHVHLLDPLIEQGMSNSEPRERNLAVALADVCRQLHGLSPTLSQYVPQRAGSLVAGASGAIEPSTHKMWMDLLGKAQSLCRELRR